MNRLVAATAVLVAGVNAGCCPTPTGTCCTEPCDCQFAEVSSVDARHQLFEKFVSQYKKGWKRDSEEWATRKELFLKEVSRIEAHNAKNLGWTENINSMSALSSSERHATFGRSKGVAQAQKPVHVREHDRTNYKAVSELPESVDWRSTGTVTSVKDQGGCGSCWAFAATETIESHVALESGQLFDLSPQQIASCAPNPDECGGTGGCAGATAEIAFDYVAGSKGMLEEYQYCYESYYGDISSCANKRLAAPKASIDGFVQLPANNYTDLMNAIATVGPIAISVDASVWHSYDSGIFNGCNQENPDIDHAVQLVGYGVDGDQKYWTVRNSWSASWGENGYIRILRQDDEDVNNCGMDITPEDGSACKGEHDPVKACGTCGILFDSSYPTGASLA